METTEVMIVSAARTPIGRFGGALKDFSAVNLGSIVIKEALDRLKNDAVRNHIDEIILGQVLQAGSGQAPAKQAGIHAGLPRSCRAIIVRKECGSSLLAVDLAFSRIRAGDAEIIIAGGMESMSQAPYLLRREGKSFGHKKVDSPILDKDLLDSMLWDGLQNAYGDRLHMGILADLIAQRHGITRQDQDEYALNSFIRAKNATREGLFKNEIVSVSLPDGKIFDTDEGIRETSLEMLAKLKPVFGENGTAGNASQLSDGAAALILMESRAARRFSIKPLAKIISCATFSLEPERFPEAPVYAIGRVLLESGLILSDIDFWEINEAFAMTPLLVMQKLSIPHEKVNVCGGAIAFGHPIGASGARILTTLLYTLLRNKARYGLATACIGGGEAIAIVIENLRR